MKATGMTRRALLSVATLLGLSVVQFALAQGSRGAVSRQTESEQHISASRKAHTLANFHKVKQWKKADALLDEVLVDDPQHAARVLSIVLKDRSIETRSHIISRIREVRLPQATGILVELLRTSDEDEGVKSWCVIALGALKQSPVAQFHLQQMLVAEHDKQKGVRLSLAKLGQSYVQYYLAGLSDIDPKRREHAIHALGVLKDKRSVPALVRLLDSDETWEAYHAALSIERVTGIPWRIVTKITKRPDGSVSRQGKRRPYAEIREDCKTWLAKHERDASQPIEEAVERWIYTPRNPLYADIRDVLYKGMSPSQVEILLGRSNRGSDAGTVWHYPKDREGNAIMIFMGPSGLQKWELRRGHIHELHNESPNQELKATGEPAP